jgi:hypothetical protein
MSNNISDELKTFAIDFRDGLIGTQPKASLYMCKLVSMPLRAALQVLRGISTDLVTEDGHTYLVTTDKQFVIDPTIDQFQRSGHALEKVLVEAQTELFVSIDEKLGELPFIELIENFKRIYSADGAEPSAKDAGSFVATYIYYPLAQQGFFDGLT